MSEFKVLDLRKMTNVCSDDCPLLQTHKGEFVGFEIYGKKKPEILIIAEAPGRQEVTHGRPLYPEAPSGKVLRTALEELGVESYALANIVCCHPVNDSGKDRQPTEEERDYCVPHLKKFIDLIRPKRVICCGRVPAFTLLPESYRKGMSITRLSSMRPYVENEVMWGAAFHPSYISRNGGIDSRQYESWVGRLKYLIFEATSEKEGLIPWTAVHVQDLVRVLDEYEQYEDIGFDYETPMTDGPWDSRCRIIGFCLVSESNTGEPVATYIYWPKNYEIEEDTRLRFLDFLKRKKPWAYNVKFEMGVTWSILGELIPINDTFALCKIDCHPYGLKANARTYLNVPEWADIVGTINSVFCNIRDIASKIPAKYSEHVDLLFEDFRKFIKEVEDPESEVGGARHRKIVVELQSLDQIEECKDMTHAEKMTCLRSSDPWAEIPVRYMGAYCCYDGWYTLLLKKKLWPVLGEWYIYYIQQSWIACVLECYGMTWDDEKAEELEYYYKDEAVQQLWGLIQMMDFKKDVIEYTNEVDKKGKPVPKTTIEEKVVKGEVKNVEVNVTHEEDCTDEVVVEASMIFKNKKMGPHEKLAKLKKIFNPMSNLKKSQMPYWRVYNNDYVRALIAQRHLETELGNLPFMSGEQIIDIIDMDSVDNSVENAIKHSETLDSYESSQIHKVISLIEWAWDEYTSHFNAPTMEYLYQAHIKYDSIYKYHCKECHYITDDEEDRCPKCDELLQTGLDIDNVKTWSKEFHMLYFLRRFKKVLKSCSSYVEGRVGRKIVSLAKTDDLMQPPTRLASYVSCMDPKVEGAIEQSKKMIKEGYKFIMNSNFFENCLVGETEIDVKEGGEWSSLTLETLAQETIFPGEFKVKSRRNGMPSIEDLKSVRLTGRTSELVEIEFDDGSKVRCTPEHRWLSKEGQDIEAADLEVGIDVEKSGHHFLLDKLFIK